MGQLELISIVGLRMESIAQNTDPAFFEDFKTNYLTVIGTIEELYSWSVQEYRFFRTCQRVLSMKPNLVFEAISPQSRMPVSQELEQKLLKLQDCREALSQRQMSILVGSRVKSWLSDQEFHDMMIEIRSFNRVFSEIKDAANQKDADRLTLLLK